MNNNITARYLHYSFLRVNYVNPKDSKYRDGIYITRCLVKLSCNYITVNYNMSVTSLNTWYTIKQLSFFATVYHSNYFPRMCIPPFGRFARLPWIITCVFVQHVVEPVYILHYDRHVAVSAAPQVYFEQKSGAKSTTHSQAITSSPPEMKETFF